MYLRYRRISILPSRKLKRCFKLVRLKKQSGIRRQQRDSIDSTMSLADELAADLDFSDDEVQEEENDQEVAADQNQTDGMDTDDAVIEDEDEQRERIESMQMGNLKSVNQVSKLLNSKTTRDILKVYRLLSSSFYKSVVQKS